MTDNVLLKKYAACMEEVKKRTEVVRAFLNGKCSTPYKQTTAESICLQIRKILELIALASLVANKNAYSEIRSKFAKDWNAKNIISDIERFNPNFYPHPTSQIINPRTGKVEKVEDIKSGWLTKNEFIHIYERTGGLLHAENPFGAKKDFDNFIRIVPTWMDKIIKLLNHHHMQLVDDDLQYWVVMNGKEDGKVQVSLFQKIGNA
ncbi:hypothetical protein [Alteromonas flava]|uniref:hypothetical protein n=1 Tax=Alteromonas flava TaxID=2048003 RepID=UPI000C284B5D|nr:hypothetical protein [Alteromonas flava]